MTYIDRRSFLKAAGVAIPLPFMPSLCAGSGNSREGSPKRLVFVDISFGFEASAFFPKTSGKDFELSYALQPLEPHRGRFTVFSNIEHIGLTGGHSSQYALLSGIRMGQQNNFPDKCITVDVKAADFVGPKTRFPALRFGVEDGTHRMSWTKDGMSLPMLTDSVKIFQKLFVDETTEAKARVKRGIDESGSILDAVLEHSRSVSRKIDHYDRQKMDEYLTSISQTEASLQQQKRWLDIPKPAMEEPEFVTGLSRNTAQVYESYYDLIMMALQTDSSRVISLQFPQSRSVFSLDKVKTGYHTLSHHGKRPEYLEELHIIERHHIEQLSRFMSKLEAHEEAGSNLLDRTAIFMGSILGNSSSHSCRKLPALLAGGGFKHQGHLEFNQPTELGNLYLTMLQDFGLEIDRFNTSKTNLDILV